ncbi:LytTR family two component transcriptional regulator [Chitinophaga niastensis]|uniref:LytTR family two component transcriptional regulator n=1 Tax=Chitinophaga niastensis TaxID=536980 RepID=A0A2P8HDR2_CHINA|nr:LytTR family DNA-binding domain-containing protein [Chitinophaga niastensis]PSL44342.1 LytTR family two component transcriptional regulator [Chitinophaga niastensis]
MKVVIIEDEVLIAEELAQLLHRHTPDVEVLAVLSSLKQSSRWLQQQPMPDLFFMDIQLSDGVIFELFDKFEINCPVIFTTAYSEYAIRAFKVNSIDYLLKPVDKEALEHAITKFRKNRGLHYRASMQEVQKVLATPGTPYYKEKFLVAYRHQLIPVNTVDIAYFRKEILIYAHTFNGEEYILDHDSLEELESLLHPAQFFRTNRQYIININAVHHVVPYSTGKMSVALLPGQHQQIDVSREKSALFKKWLGA